MWSSGLGAARASAIWASMKSLIRFRAAIARRQPGELTRRCSVHDLRQLVGEIQQGLELLAEEVGVRGQARGRTGDSAVLRRTAERTVGRCPAAARAASRR